MRTRRRTGGVRCGGGVPQRRRGLVQRRAQLKDEVHVLKRDDLVEYISQGCRPKEEWRIGTEHEKFAFRLSDRKRADYSDIRQMLNKLCKEFSWDPIMEGENIIGATLEGQSVTLEPGGQLELSGAPLRTLQETCAETQSHLHQMKSIAAEQGIAFLGLGFDPSSTFPECPMMPKNRYNIMKAYMPTRGNLGHDMMFRSCTIQVNLDFESEEDMVRKARASLALQPVATALFANSPLKEGKLTGYQSYRRRVWDDVDPDRCGYLPWIFEEGFGFERYVDYALSVPMYFVYRNGRYIDVSGQSFGDFMKGNLSALPGEVATMKDWEDHLTTIFPEIRLKRFLEMRGADGGPWDMICALPAFWVGLLYDEQALGEAEELVSSWTAKDRLLMQQNVAKEGLKLKCVGGGGAPTTMQELAKEVLRISAGGLERRGYNEVDFLDKLNCIAGRGQSQAEDLMSKYTNLWNGNIDPIFVTQYGL
ncbi:glutamate--cysteine ligase [Chloropicon primus]|uniref:Glutamate--cysteine ligase n=1 Tax=Chloropicon primus TaxID=1764295 RepID=A0A5B8MW72_9CHLO|nr:glutamate--cysteine ligase [Chloropicon primus]UPR03088.1 glutamate--cysteine ligase [Chloropicon primus]|eukprot:QDZ23875.1 glutamate--cysteine ligase [Chloropicon primus]